MTAPTELVEAEMIRGGWRAQFAVRERMANPRREAAPKRLIRLGRWHGPVGFRAPVPHRPPWPGQVFLSQQGDPS
jgi:hypothetical protein